MSMDEYASNWEQQIEEVQVLSSIFEKDFQFLGFGNDGSQLDDCDVTTDEQLQNLTVPTTPTTIEIQITVEVRFPKDNLTLKFNSQQQSDEIDCSNNDEAEGQTIQYLPKLDLWLCLGPKYPSQSPPQFEVSAFWLSSYQVRKIQEQFEQIWREKQAEDAGSIVVYDWVEWLQESLLEFLGCETVLCIQTAQKYGAQDEDENMSLAGPSSAQVSSGGFDAAGKMSQFDDPAEQVFVQLLRFDRVMEQQEFMRCLHTCEICFEDKLGSYFVRIPECGHQYCQECLQAHCQVHVQEGNLSQLRCFNPDCKQLFSQQILLRILSEEQYSRWEAFSLQQALDSMQDVTYCPRCESIALEDQNFAQCPQCLFVFCSMCMQSYHPGSECLSKEQQLQVLKERQERGAYAGAKKAEETRRKIENLQNELISVQYVKAQGGKSCPRCQFVIVKDGGCNKVTCSKCGTFMCWKCGSLISGYDHFQKGCILFDEAGLEEYQAYVRYEAQGRQLNQYRQEAARQVANEQGQAIRRTTCPQCLQGNWKLNNNNHLRCWACLCHFCYQCRSILPKRGGGRHFKPSACKQHSDD